MARKIMFMDKVYSTGDGGGGGGGIASRLLYKAQDTTQHNITLNDDWTNYESLLITMLTPNKTSDASFPATVVNVASIVDGMIVGMSGNGYSWYRLFPSNSTTTIEYWISQSSYYIDSVVGIGSGGGSSGGGSSIDYSTTEQQIGTWMGKPLYQKVFDNLNVNVSNGSWINITTIQDGLDLIDIKLWGQFAEYYMLIPSQAHIDSSSGILEVYYYGLNATRTVTRVAVQYTKTTD